MTRKTVSFLLDFFSMTDFYEYKFLNRLLTANWILFVSGELRSAGEIAFFTRGKMIVLRMVDDYLNERIAIYS